MARVVKSKAEKLIDKRVEQLYYKRCHGITISMFDIGKVFAVGRAAIAEGKDDQAVGDAIYNFVQSIKVA
jgi:hypothetical protein